MAFLGETFSTNDLPKSERTYELLPDGWYDARITEANLGATKAGTGEKISMRYDIIGPTHQGRVVYGNLNIRNPSAVAERIGREQLHDIMLAIGLASIEDTDQLVGGTCQIKIKTKPAKDGYDARNEIAGWKASGGGSAAPAPAAPAAAASAPSTAPAKAPWQK